MQRLILASFVCMVLSCNSDKEGKPSEPSENWVIAEKKFYDYKLNSVGRPDTVYVYNKKFRDGLVVDSSTTFTVNRYNGDYLSDEMSFVVKNNREIVPFTNTKYTFDNKGRSTSQITSGAGKLIKDERYYYNDSGLLTKTVLVQIKNYDIATGGPLELTTASSSSIGYDTLTTLYEYDKTNKVIGSKYVDNRGAIFSKDVNIYSGNDPLLTATINTKGDTIKKITYEKRNKIFMTVTETDSFYVFQNYVNGIPIAQKTKYKNRNEQWRSAVKFDQNGRKVEEVLYKAM